MSGARPDLYARAANNYRLAGLHEPAARCYLSAGQPAQAAPLLAATGRAREAALAWEAAGEHASAARCWEQQGELDNAARAWVAAGQPTTAAWIYAHHLGQGERALSLLEPLQPEDARAAAELRFLRDRARGRTEAILAVLAALQTGGADGGLSLVDRALAFADRAGRLDLIASLHAAMAGLGVPPDVWRGWAADRLHDASGVPLADAAPQEAR